MGVRSVREAMAFTRTPVPARFQHAADFVKSLHRHTAGGIGQRLQVRRYAHIVDDMFTNCRFLVEKLTRSSCSC